MWCFVGWDHLSLSLFLMPVLGAYGTPTYSRRARVSDQSLDQQSPHIRVQSPCSKYTLISRRINAYIPPFLEGDSATGCECVGRSGVWVYRLRGWRLQVALESWDVIWWCRAAINPIVHWLVHSVSSHTLIVSARIAITVHQRPQQITFRLG